MIALVLAAGFGTRFRPATLVTPKPLLPFLGRPILFHLFDHLIAEGIDRLVVNSHHLAEVLERVVGADYRGVPVSFSREAEILGTTGAIRRAREAGLLGDDGFFVVNGDLFTNLPLAPLRGAAEESVGAAAASALAVLPNPTPDRDTPLWGDDGWLAGIGARPAGKATGPWLFTGIQYAGRSLLERIPAGRTELARDVLAPSLARGERAFRLVRCPQDVLWFDLGTPERLRTAEERVRRAGRPVTGDSRLSGPSPTRRSGSGPTTG